LLVRDIGNDAAADFISSLADTELILEAPLAEDYLRSAEILRQYADANLHFVDALIAATAERLNIKRLLTLDRRDFQLIRPRHCDSFELLPKDREHFACRPFRPCSPAPQAEKIVDFYSA